MTSTPIAKMVREMIARGVDPDVIELAVGTAETVARADIPQNSADMSADRRRARDRERKRGVRGNPQNSAEIPQTQETPLTEEERKKERKRETTRGSRLPVGWTPADPDWQETIGQIGEPKAKSELEKFRDHWAQQPGARGVKLDWNAAWRNWIRRAAEYSTPRNGAQNGRRTVHDAANDLAARLQAFDEPAPGGICGGEGQGALRLIPSR